MTTLYFHQVICNYFLHNIRCLDYGLLLTVNYLDQKIHYCLYNVWSLHSQKFIMTLSMDHLLCLPFTLYKWSIIIYCIMLKALTVTDSLWTILDNLLTANCFGQMIHYVDCVMFESLTVDGLLWPVSWILFYCLTLC